MAYVSQELGRGVAIFTGWGGAVATWPGKERL